MLVPRGLVAEVRRKVVTEMNKLGFVKHGRGCNMIKPLVDDVDGCAAFSSATRRGNGVVYAQMSVAIIHTKLEHTIAKLKGVGFHKYEASSYGTNLGYVMPEKSWKEWRLNEFSEIEPTVDEIIQSFVQYGLPFLREHTTLQSIYNLISTEPILEIQPRVYKIPIILLMMGEKEKAREYVEMRLVQWQNETYPAAEEYRHFAHKFLISL